MKRLPTFFSLFLFAYISIIFQVKAQSASEWNQRSYSSTYGNGQSFYYLEYLPKGYRDNTDAYPVIISLHGLGYATPGTTIFWNRLKGADFEKTIQAGRDYPFIILTPHQPTEVAGRYNYSGQNPDGTNVYDDSLRWDTNIIDEVLERAKTELRIDPSRIYLLGSSMGGGGVWAYLKEHGEKIAAAVPVAGYTVFNDESGDVNVYTEYPSAIACNDKVKNTPIWAFHAADDNWISPLYAYKGVKAVNNCSPTPSPLAKLTMFANGGHVNVQQKIFQYTGNSSDYVLTTDPTYTSDITLTPYLPDNEFNDDIFAWFLTHTNNVMPPPPPAISVDLGADFSIVPVDNSTEIPSTVNGSPVAYSWIQISGPNTATLFGRTGPTLTASNLITDQTYASQNRPEGYVFRLTVTDNKGNTAFDEINVKLAAPTYAGSKMEPWTYEKIVTGWDTSPFLPYRYIPGSNKSIYMPFRIIYPKDYTSRNDGKKYPLILMIHGRGERGTDNDFQLKNGGKVHRDAVLNGKFDGFVLFPQYPVNPDSPLPTSTDIDRMAAIVQELLAHEKIDPDRVHVHGLSTGGRTVWEIIKRYPKLFASAMPMAWSEDRYWYPDNMKQFIHLPLWVSQGGQDGTASPEKANTLVSKIRETGGNVRYLYFPSYGHNVWDATYADPDFFPFFLRHKKTDILVYYGQTSFCEDDAINVRLGITAGFDGYEWQKNGATFATGVNEVVVTDIGDYRVRFKRGTVWTDWSEPVNINRNRAPSPTPSLTTDKKSVHLPSLDGSDEVTLHATSGYAQYFWYKNGQLINGATNPLLTVNEAGSYTATAVEQGPPPLGVIPEEFRPEPARCESLPSEAMIVTTQNGPNAPKAPSNLFAYTRSETSVELKFDDNATNENGFEIYRATQSGGPYTIIDIISANNQSNPVAYLDNNLKDGTQYYYRIRAVNNDGGSPYSNEAKAGTLADDQPPAAPQNLIIAQSTRSSITIQWNPAADNVGIVEYLVYQDGNLIATTKNTSYVSEGLVAKTAYTFVIRAKDAAGNVSSPSNQVTGATINDGLFYSYYHVSGISTVNDIVAKGQLIKTGHLDNFSLAPKERGDYFAFIYEGNIIIPTTGQYTFYTSSDDGSRLFIDGQEIVNNDGDHGNRERSGTINLSEGAYPIKVMFYEAGGGEVLTVSWKGPGINKENIPDAALRDDFTYPNGPATPGNLQAVASSFKQINLTWQDNSSNETGFELYRGTSTNGPFTIIFTTAADVTAYADTTLTGNTTYYFKVRAINENSASGYTSVQSAKTLPLPSAPAQPANLTATATGPSSIRLNWTDVSSNETGFEIWRTTSVSGNGFALAQAVPANETSYQDIDLPGNTTLYYKIRAKGDGGYSAFTNVVSATTNNNVPVLQEILSRTVKFNTTLSFDIFVTDPDANNTIDFEITGLPSFGSFINNNDRTGTFTFSPGGGDGGSYNLQVKVMDNAGGSSTQNFTVTVNNNSTPGIAAIANQEVNQGQTLNLNVTATDADGNAPLKLSLLNNPDFVAITDNGSGRGVITIKPDIFEVPGTFRNIQVIANDQQGGIGTSTFDLVVKGVDKDFTVYVNFSSGTFASFPWNNTGDASNANNVVGKITDEEGKKTGMSLKLRESNGPAWSSSRSTVNSELYVKDVRDTRYWSYSSPNYLTLSGLNPLLNYNFTIFGNEENSNNRSCITQYTIGSKSVELQAMHNTGETVSLTNIKPDQNGNITIKVSRKSTSEWKMVISSMVIQGYYDNGSAPDAPTNLSAQALSPTEVRLTWLDNSKSEEGFEILRSTNSNGPFQVVATTGVNATTFIDNNNVVGRTTYFYKVRAFNNNGQSPESNVFTVITPNSPPVLDIPVGAVVKVGGSKTVNILATDHENDPITLRVTGMPSFGRFTDNGNGTGTLTFSPASIRDVGQYILKISALDDRNDSNTKELILTVVSNEYDEAVYVNFGNGSEAGEPWNNTDNIPVANQVYANLKNALGNTSTVAFTVVSGWNGAENKGVNTNTNTGVYPDSVIQSYWYSGTSASLKFSGLNASKLYNFIFFASNQLIQEGTTTYAIGSQSVQLNAANNSQNTAQLSGIVPDSNGEVLLTVSKGQFSSGAYLGTMVIQSYQSQTPLSPTQLTAQAVSRTQVRLKWKDNAGNETGYKVHRSQSPNANYSLIATLGSNISTYLDNTATKNSTYYYKVQAVNNSLVSEYSNIGWATTYEYLIYINFVGNTAKYTMAPAPWNNTKASPSTGLSFNNLKNDVNASTPVDLVIDNWQTAGFDNDLGISTGNNSGIYPDAVLKSFYFAEHGEFVKFRVEDLDPDYNYSFIFLGSGDPNIDLFQTAGNLTTKYTIGQTTVIQNALGNSQETVQIDGVVPDGNNEVFLEIRPETYANYAIFNSLIIGAYTPSAVVVDELAPSVPMNLTASNIAPDKVTLSWDPSTDNSGTIASYEIYNGSQLVTTINGNTNIQMITNTVPGNVYDFHIVAVDGAGNRSLPSEVLSINYEVVNGLNYAYYESTWNAMPDFTALTPVKTGFVDNFSLNPKERNSDFGFRFYGYINITATGNYTFYTKSNTGSKLYIDGVEVVSNDYANSWTERSGTVNGLSSGWHAIVVDYRNAQEADRLMVRYRGPGITKRIIPDNVLYRANLVAPVSQPVEFLQVSAELKGQKVLVNWSTASEYNNDYFTIEKSYDLDNFVSVGKVKGSENSNDVKQYSFVDKQLRPGNIYYRIRQTDFDGKEKYSNVVNVRTDAIFKLTEVILFPNPATRENINLKVASRNADSEILVTMVDLMGNVVFEGTFHPEELMQGRKIESRNELRAGTYIITIRQGNQVVHRRMIIHR